MNLIYLNYEEISQYRIYRFELESFISESIILVAFIKRLV